MRLFLAAVGLVGACGGIRPALDEGGFGVSATTTAPNEVLRVRWRRHLVEEPFIEYKPQEFAAGEPAGGRVYVGSSAGTFWAFDVRDGGSLWHRNLGAGIGARPRVVTSLGLVVIGTQGGGLFGLDLATGQVRWRYDVQGPIESQPTYHDGTIYFTTGENRVYAVNAVTGKWRWQYERDTPDNFGFTIRGYGSPLHAEGRVYVGFSDGHLTCLNAQTGEVSWNRSLSGEATRFTDVDATPIYHRGVLYVASHAGGLYALDPKDGSTRWRYDVEGASTVTVSRGLIHFASPTAGLVTLDLEGHEVWRQGLQAKNGELSPPLAVGGMVIASQAGGTTYVVDALTGRMLMAFRPGKGVTSVATTDGRQIYILSNGGYFYALQIRA